MERSADWMDQAQGDLEHAKSDLERGFYDWACFSTQQAAEKAVKAVFQKMGAEAWGHSVADLMEELSSSYSVPEALRDVALELDKPISRHVTLMPTPLARHDADILVRKPKEWWPMQSKSSSSVKVFYPPFSREDLLALLPQRIAALQGKLPLKRVVLFGSYATGRQTVASDIDLLVIYAGKRREDAYALVKRTLNIRRLEPHVYAEEEYEQARMTVERMARGGIPVVLGEC